MDSSPVWRPSLDVSRLADLPWPVEVVATSPSTNAELVERAAAGAGAQVLVADHQTSGRGRLDRSWETPAGAAATLSVLLRPSAPSARWPWLPLVAGLAAVESLPGEPRLKWPNDVLYGDAKVAGILLERVEGAGPGQPAAAILGIGVNVSTTREELPVPTATSLALEGHDVAREDVVAGFLTALGDLVAAWERGESLADRYTAACATVGRDVVVHLPGEQRLVGTAEGVDDSGRLLVRTGSGLTAVAAGDVVHVRSAEGDMI